MHIFTNHIEGVFLSRPNRFIVLVEIPAKENSTEVVRCHCPNPGRLWELLLPRTKVILQKNNPGGGTTHTLVAVYSRGLVVPLYAAKSNQMVEELVIPKIFPHATKVEREVTWGKSRFDFRVTTTAKTIYIEVKSCSLIEYNIAMFPDAPSERATKHLKELVELSKEPHAEGHVIFVLQSPRAEQFIPNIHTDPIFAQTMWESRRDLSYHGIAIETQADGEVTYHGDVPINLDPVEQLLREKRDSGVYMILFKIPEATTIPIGKLGETSFAMGYYIYTGSAKTGLSKRVNRHLARRKKKHWHMDYLISHATWKKAVPIYTTLELECPMAQSVQSLGGRGIPNFGCSDCDCDSHLFYFDTNPLEIREFLDLLFYLRHRGFFGGIGACKRTT